MKLDDQNARLRLVHGAPLENLRNLGVLVEPLLELRRSTGLAGFDQVVSENNQGSVAIPEMNASRLARDDEIR